MYYIAGLAVITWVLSLALVPSLGAVGFCIANVLSESISILLLIHLRKYVNVSIFKDIIKPLVIITTLGCIIFILSKFVEAGNMTTLIVEIILSSLAIMLFYFFIEKQRIKAVFQSILSK